MRLDWHGDPDSGSEELPGVSEANTDGGIDHRAVRAWGG